MNEGAEPRGEHWHSHKWFPFTQDDDWWFKNGTLSASNTYIHIPGKTPVSGWTMANATYTDVTYGPIADSVFAHPDSRPTFGKCKRCGFDDQCPMSFCMG